MFDSPYPFDKVSIVETLMPNPQKKVFYRFKAAKRKYFVTLEVYSFGVVAIKYCDIKDKDSSNAYKKIFNDHDSFKVITTCLFIMLEYWKNNPQVTFAFHAVPRDFTQKTKVPTHLKKNQLDKFCTEYQGARFNIYKYAMVNLFPPTNFNTYRDSKNFLYVLLNRKQKKPKNTLKLLGKYLLNNYDMVFEPDEQ